MGKVRLKVSFEKLTFEYEGDHETGMAVNRAMNATLGSLMDAHNKVIDVTPTAHPIRMALPAVATTSTRRKRHRHKASANDVGIPHADAVESDSPEIASRVRYDRRPRTQGLASQLRRLIDGDFFSQPQTSENVRDALMKKAFNAESWRITDRLNRFVRQEDLTKDKNTDGVWAFQQGSNNDVPGS